MTASTKLRRVLDYWRRQRKFAHTILSQAHRIDFHAYPSIEAKRMHYDLMHNPSNYSKILENFTSRVMCRLVWGNPNHAEDLQADAWKLLVQMSPAGPITNVLTPLLWIPNWLSPWMRKEKKRHDAQRAWFIERQNEVRALMAEKRAGPSFMKTYFETRDGYNFDNDVEGAYAVGMLGVAGVFTIGSPLHTFILGLVLNPEWMKPMQEEIDRVCGDRPPEMSDYPNLPMVRAVIKECLRWRPAVPTGTLVALQFYSAPTILMSYRCWPPGRTR
jgi:cytochrome P450